MPRAATPGPVAVHAALALAALVGAASVAQAGDVRPRVDAALCVPGGIAAVPLERTAGAAWPARIPVRIGDLRSQAPVVWVGGVADDGQRWWTRSPEQVDARPAAEMPETPTPESVGEVLALIELPAVGEGSLEVDGVTVAAQWLVPPVRPRADAPVLAVPATFADDRPDPGTPVEHWRWSLVAQRQGARVAEPRGDACDRLWARHVEGLWMSGLARVRVVSRGIHDELCELLAGTADDPERGAAVAAWIARPEELRALLAILVDPERSDADAAQAALTWVRQRWTCTAWIEEDAGDRVRLAVANPTSGERVLRLAWVAPDAAPLPVAVVAPPHRVVRTWVERVAVAPRSGDAADVRVRAEALDATDGAARLRIPVGAREYPVEPPALAFGAFAPALRLADAQAMSISPVDAAWRTTASLRRRDGRWELFVEAFRPSDAPDRDADEVVVRLGDADQPTHVLAVSGAGSLQMRTGDADGVSAGFMAWEDRWRARIELPEAWLPAPGSARPLLLSTERNPGRVRSRQFAGLARPAWATSAAPVLVDLGRWEDIGR